MKKIFYRVDSGETILSVSGKFRAPVSQLILDNDLKEEIEAGDLLVINLSEQDVYTVCALEDYKIISKKLGVSENELKQVNNLPYLFYGVKIIIPK